jgi:hypothetical protein
MTLHLFHSVAVRKSSVCKVWITRIRCNDFGIESLVSLYKPQKVVSAKKSVGRIEKITVAKSEPEGDQIIIRSRPEK